MRWFFERIDRRDRKLHASLQRMLARKIKTKRIVITDLTF
jgi:hypothetical protein